MDTPAKDSSGSSSPDRKHELHQPSAPVPVDEVKVEHAYGDAGPDGVVPVVSAEVERRLLRKLDIRIVPMVMWIYLMNFMDRGKQFRTVLFCPGALFR